MTAGDTEPPDNDSLAIFLGKLLQQRYNLFMQPTIANHIEIRKNRRGEPRAFVTGTRVRVQDIVTLYERHGKSGDGIVREYPHLSLAQVHTSLAYYFENQAEIQAALKSDREFAAAMKKRLNNSNPNMDAGSDSISS